MSHPGGSNLIPLRLACKSIISNVKYFPTPHGVLPFTLNGQTRNNFTDFYVVTALRVTCVDC